MSRQLSHAASIAIVATALFALAVHVTDFGSASNARAGDTVLEMSVSR